MTKELELWRFAASKLKRGESVMLLTVAENFGSSPGRKGFKMIVARDALAGSVGGGVMEVRLVEQAKRELENGKRKTENESPKPKVRKQTSRLVEQIHRKNAPNASGMICSGKQTVIFYRLEPKHLKIVEKIIDALENCRFEFLRITTESFDVANLPSAKESSSQTKSEFAASFDFNFEKQSETEFFYEERLGFKNKLFIVGGGHCALALSELMSKMDFHISLFDDRAGLNTLEKNKFAHEIRVIESYERIADFIPSGENVYTIVMTIGYKFDEIVIRRLFDKNFKYFGVLGSRAKMKTLLRNLEKEGFDREKLEKIRTPVGLPINSRTPEEIAVSIAAEIIKVKNSK